MPAEPHRRAPSSVAIIGGGPAGMTAALLLADAGHRVEIFDAGPGLGGLWASRLDDDGYFRGDNSCKVFQPSYVTAPALFERIGTRWQDHFTARHDLTSAWLRPFVAACTARDLALLGRAFVQHRLGRGALHELSVAEFMERHDVSEGCRRWMRATALGGIAGTLRMTVWELFHRIGSNLGEIFIGSEGTLYWNAQPPNAPGGFVSRWAKALHSRGVIVHAGQPVAGVRLDASGRASVVVTRPGLEPRRSFDAVFLAVPPPALGRLLADSDPSLAEGFGLDPATASTYLGESVYTHLGITWFFDRPLPHDLPLGGHNVRRGWYPILVQHDQYGPHLRPPAVTTVVASVAVDTEFTHHRLGTRAADHTPQDLAAIIWDDERSVDASLPVPIDVEIMGQSSATQIVGAGPLDIQSGMSDVLLATNLHGRAPYFTASLESAIQAGAIAAGVFDARVRPLPMGSPRPTPWSERHRDPPRRRLDSVVPVPRGWFSPESRRATD